MTDGESAQLVGSVLGNTYEVVRPLGRGGMGVVYQATNVRIGKKFAIKLLTDQARADRETLQRFRREALIATDIGHPHIVDVIDFHETDDGVPYMVMEFLVGQDLGAALESEGPLPVERTVLIAAQICSALQAAHEHGVVHRDIKPANIFLCQDRDREDFVKVLDFGVSKILGTDQTSAGLVVGTPCFMAPEQAENAREQIGPRTDIFALGTVLYQVLSGKQAFVADSVPALLYQIVSHQPTALDRVGAVSTELAAVIDKAMAKAPADRFGTMNELAEALLEAVPLPAGQAALLPQRRASRTTGEGAFSKTLPVSETPAANPSTLSSTAAESIEVSADQRASPRRSRVKAAAALGTAALLVAVLVSVVVNRASRHDLASRRTDHAGRAGLAGQADLADLADRAGQADSAGELARADGAARAPAADAAAAAAAAAPVPPAVSRPRDVARRQPRRRRRRPVAGPDAAAPRPAVQRPDAGPNKLPGLTPEW